MSIEYEKMEVTPETQELSCSPSQMFCPHCGMEQDEHPRNVIDPECNTDYDCDHCGKTFTVETVYYLLCKK